MKRYILILLYLCFLSLHVVGQPAHVLKASYNEKTYYVDSLGASLPHASSESVATLSELAKWAYDHGDNELASAVDSCTERLGSATRSKW